MRDIDKEFIGQVFVGPPGEMICVYKATGEFGNIEVLQKSPINGSIGGLLSNQKEADDKSLGKEDRTMTDMFITITGMQFRHGAEFLERGDVVKLIKEPDNEYDKEAIRVEIKPLGKIGYVANSTKTVIGDCFSAGRLYDKIGDKAKAEIVFVLPTCVVARVTTAKSKK